MLKVMLKILWVCYCQSYCYIDRLDDEEDAELLHQDLHLTDDEDEEGLF